MKRLLITILLCACSQPAWSVGPYVYLAQTENYCAELSGNIYYLYVYSPDDADFSGVSFDLDISGTVSATPFISVDAGSGVILQAVDTSSLPYHIELGWTPRALMHEVVATLLFPAPPVWDQGPKTTNVVFTRPGGETVTAQDFQTYPGYPGGCHNCFLCFQIEERILVPAGRTTTIPFEWVFMCYSPGGLNILVSDTQGWVTSWNPTGGTGSGYCHACFVEFSPGTIEVAVPLGTPTGVTSSLRLEGNLNGYLCPGTATLEVTESVPVEQTTWSAIKALYR